jgi:hypothetical protein
VVLVLTAAIGLMLLLAGVGLALGSRPAPTRTSAWGDVCLYPMNRPPGYCITLPEKLPLL